MKIANERGVALITVLFFLIIITILSVGTIMVATTQINVAGSMAHWETSFDANEGGQDFVVPLIQSVYYDRFIPASYNSFVKDTDLAVGLIDELTDPANNFDDDALYPLPDSGYPGAVSPPAAAEGPDVVVWLGNDQVEIDIDAMGLTRSEEGSDRMQIGYYAQGKASKLNMYSGFRIEVRSATTKTKVETVQTIGLPIR